MLNASAAAFNFNRLSYDNYAWPGTPDPRRINHLDRSRNDSQVFIYFVLINARNWLRLVALAGNEGRGAAKLWKIGGGGTAAATEKGTDRPRRGGFAQQPERSSRSPLSRSFGQPCNFRLLPISSTDILRGHLIEPLFFVLYAYDFIDFRMYPLSPFICVSFWYFSYPYSSLLISFLLFFVSLFISSSSLFLSSTFSYLEAHKFVLYFYTFCIFIIY